MPSKVAETTYQNDRTKVLFINHDELATVLHNVYPSDSGSLCFAVAYETICCFRTPGSYNVTHMCGEVHV